MKLGVLGRTFLMPLFQKAISLPTEKFTDENDIEFAETRCSNKVILLNTEIKQSLHFRPSIHIIRLYLSAPILSTQI